MEPNSTQPDRANAAATGQSAPADLARYSHLLQEAEKIQGVSLGKDAWRRLKRKRVAMGSLIFLVIVCVLAVLTPALPLQAPRIIKSELQFAPPVVSPLFIEEPLLASSAEAADGTQPRSQDELDKDGFGELNWFDHGLLRVRLKVFGGWCFNSICGRDKLGRDLLSRLFWGARVSLLVGFVATLVSLVIGVSYGAISGYMGGSVDNAMMRFVDVLYSIPFIFVVIFLITVLSEEYWKTKLETIGVDRIVIFFAVVGAIYWLTMARVVRGQVLSLKQEQFVEAARCLGASRWRIIFLHLVPNLLSVIIVYLTLTIPRVMLFEAFLSFLGLGVEPPNVSWGLLANDGIEVITPIKILWWLVVFPALALGSTLFALNFLGDGLRDALDPRMKNR